VKYGRGFEGEKSEMMEERREEDEDEAAGQE
jgi:hypothetical protein